MGKRGPQPLSDEVLRARGSTVLKKRARLAVAAGRTEGAPSAIVAPEWLSQDERQCWDLLVPILENLQVIAAVDAFTLGRYCNSMVLWLEVSKKIRATPMLIKSEANPQPYANPYFKIRADLARELQAMEDRFGLTPAARITLHVAVTSDKKEEDTPAPIDGAARFFRPA